MVVGAATGAVIIAGRTRQGACLDHCHATGAKRGWLCNNCNVMLGNAKDSPAILRKAAEYLDSHRLGTCP